MGDRSNPPAGRRTAAVTSGSGGRSPPDQPHPIRLDRRSKHRYDTPIIFMPKNDMPSGALTLLILRVLRSGSMHGYAIAQRIHSLSSEVLQVEEGALYPALQKLLLKGWAT